MQLIDFPPKTEKECAYDHGFYIGDAKLFDYPNPYKNTEFEKDWQKGFEIGIR